MNRKYSDAFVQRRIDQIISLKQKTDDERMMLPTVLDREENSWLKGEIITYARNRSDYSYIQGFWYGWSLKSGDPDEKRSQTMSKKAKSLSELAAQIQERDAFLERLLNPSDLGHAVTPEVRDLARALLGIKAVESGLKTPESIAVPFGFNPKKCKLAYSVEALVGEENRHYYVLGIIDPENNEFLDFYYNSKISYEDFQDLIPVGFAEAAESCYEFNQKKHFGFSAEEILENYGYSRVTEDQIEG